MKTLLIALSASALLAAPAVAQEATKPAAAATLPNAFDGPSGRPATPPPPSEIETPAADPRAEAALRGVIAGMQSGEPDYDAFTADLATKIRQMAPQATPLIQQFGALQSVQHQGKQGQLDLYRVTFANQATEWMIALNAEDKIAALLFRPAE